MKCVRRFMTLVMALFILAGPAFPAFAQERQLSDAIGELDLEIEFDAITESLLEEERDLAAGISDGRIEYQLSDLNMFYQYYFDALLMYGQPGEMKSALAGYITAIRTYCDGYDWRMLTEGAFNEFTLIPAVFDILMIYADQDDPQISSFCQWFVDSVIPKLEEADLPESLKGSATALKMSLECDISLMKDPNAPLTDILHADRYNAQNAETQIYIDMGKMYLSITESCRKGDQVGASEAFNQMVDLYCQTYAMSVQMANDANAQETAREAEDEIASALGSMQDTLFVGWKRGVVSAEVLRQLIAQAHVSAALQVAKISGETASAACPFREGDCLTAVDGLPVGTSKQFFAMLFLPQPGERTITLIRDGSRQDIALSGPEDLTGVELNGVLLGANEDSLGFKSDRLIVRK